MVCEKCGKDNEEGAGVCAFCGARLLPSGDAAPTPAQRRAVAVGKTVATIMLLGFLLLVAAALGIGIPSWRTQAKRTACLSNVRLITLAALMYG